MLAALAYSILCGGLEKEVPVDLVQTPLAEAVEQIRRRSGLPVVLDTASLGERLSAPVTFRAKSIPAGEALKWVARLAGARFAVCGGEMVVSTDQALTARRAVLRIYDLADASRRIPGFLGDDYVTLEDPEVAVRPRQPPHGPRFFGWRVDTKAQQPRLKCGALAEFVQTHVRPETWEPELGTSIEERSNSLVVIQTPEVHAEIERVLERFRRMAMRTVAIRVEEMVVAESAVAEAVRTSASFLLSAASADEVRKKGVKKRSVSIQCFDGQLASAHGGRAESVLAGIAAEGAESASVVERVRSGLSIVEMIPFITDGGRAVMLQIVLRSCEEPEIIEFSPFDGSTFAAADKPLFTPAVVELPSRQVAGFSAVFEIPVDRVALFSAGDGTRVFLVSAELVRP